MNLSTTVASNTALFLDFTPPFPGMVWDGTKVGLETKFTYIDDMVSANWNGFHDPESGIQNFGKTIGKGV